MSPRNSAPTASNRPNCFPSHYPYSPFNPLNSHYPYSPYDPLNPHSSAHKSSE